MERIVSATEARVRFGEVMRRVVEDAEAVIVERDGKPQVVLISIDQYREFMAKNTAEPLWETMLREVHERLTHEPGNREMPPAEEIVRQMREERDEQIEHMLR